MSDENEGILGNLPRSRPGVRSEKRAAGGKQTAGTAKRTAAAKPKQPRAPKPRASAAKSPPPPPPPAPKSEDPIGLAVRAAGQVAETGFKVASRMASEVLRRLPRP